MCHAFHQRSFAVGLAAAFCFVQASENNEKDHFYLPCGISNLYGYCFALWFLIRRTCVAHFSFEHENRFLNGRSWDHYTRDRESGVGKKDPKNVFQLYDDAITARRRYYLIHFANEARKTIQLFCKRKKISRKLLPMKNFNCKFPRRGSQKLTPFLKLN